MKDLNRAIAFWLLSKYCGELLSSLKKVNFNDRTEKVVYDYIHGGNKSRDDYEYLVEQFRIFQHLQKDNWIIRELLK